MMKYDIQYYHCKRCGFLYTEYPYWLNEAYKSPMNISDTGILLRNIYLSKCASSIIYFFFDKKAKFLDYAGGYGVFTRLMRDIGFDFFWHDPFTKNIFARGFEWDEEKKYEMLTSFESFEHFSDPLSELEKMLKISDSIFFSTMLLPKHIPTPDRWWYYGIEHGQHVSFYSKSTLKFIAQKYELNYYPIGDIHLFTAKKINNFLFKLVAKASSYGLYYFVRKRLKSKTFSDMQNMINTFY